MPSGFDYKRDILPVRTMLSERFPSAFTPKRGGVKRPLKIGIRRDLEAMFPEIRKSLLKAVISDYCNGPKYSAAMVVGAERVDLEGRPAGIVEQRDVDHALDRELKRRSKQRKDDRRAAAEARP